MKIRWGARCSTVLLGVIGSVVVSGFFSYVSANRYESPSFTIDASVGNSFGGVSGSDNYGLVSSGGEAIIGNGASGSYKLGQGFSAQLEKSILMWTQPDSIEMSFSMELINGTRIFNNAWNMESAEVYSGGLAIPTAGVTSTPGKVGQALNFDGTNEIDMGNIVGSAMTGSTTVSMWLRPTDFSVAQNPYARDFAGVGAITQEQDGTLTYRYGPNGGEASPYQEFRTNTSLPLNEWSHVAIVRNLDDMTLTWFINGVQDVQAPANYATVNKIPFSTKIGGGYLSDGYRGGIDELKIYYDAVTSATIKAEYDANQQGVSSGVGIPEITPGAPQYGWIMTFTQTDSVRFGIAISQNHDLKSGEHTIPPISSGSIDNPALWSDGVTKGLGFSAPADYRAHDVAKWGDSSTPRFAAIPSNPTTVFTQNINPAEGAWNDFFGVQVDVEGNQPAGSYSNSVTLMATIIP